MSNPDAVPPIVRSWVYLIGAIIGLIVGPAAAAAGWVTIAAVCSAISGGALTLATWYRPAAQS